MTKKNESHTPLWGMAFSLKSFEQIAYSVTGATDTYERF
jgi:hypothetical protein